MTDGQRYQYLLDHRAALRFSDEFTINRVNYDFLLNSHNKYIKLQMEHEALKREMKKIKNLHQFESKLSKMSERMEELV